MKYLLVTFLAILFAAPSAADPHQWVTVAEILTARSGPATIGYRLFSAPDFAALCSGVQPERLVRPSAPVNLYVGELFELDALEIAAIGQNAERIDRVPLAMDVEENVPPVLDLGLMRESSNVLLPLRPGHLRFRIRSLCAGRSLEVYWDAAISVRGDTTNDDDV